jgi:hypothetical protein
MKNIIAVLVFLFSVSAFSQIHNPVKWTTKVNKISNTEFELVATAIIAEKWHLYSQTVPENGPNPTSFTFVGNASYLKKGNTKEEQGHTIADPVFKMNIKYFENKAVFRQLIKLKNNKAFPIKASVEFMVCNDAMCLPPTEADLVFQLK